MLGRLQELVEEGDHQSLRKRVLSSGLWASMLNVLHRSSDLVRVIVVAVFLSPGEFGVFGIAMLTLATLNAFSETGFDRALIQLEESNIDPYLDSVWVVKVVRGVALFTVAVFAAPSVATFFSEPAATPLIRAVAATAVLKGLQNPAVIYFEKDLEFRKKFLLMVPASVVGTALAIAIAVETGSVWALVVGSLVTWALTTVASYLVHPYRPSVRLDVDRALELFRFGKWITGLTIITYLVTTFDDVFVGWYLSASLLGLYQMAYRLSNLPATEVTDILNSVMRPAFANVKNDSEELRSIFLDTSRTLLLLVLPLSLGILVVADPFVRALYGPDWYPMIPAMQVFAAVAMLRGTLSAFGPVFEALDRPDFQTKTQTIAVVGIAVSIVPLTEAFGIAGAAAATGMRFVVSAPIILYLAFTQTTLTPRDLISVVAPPAAASALMVGAVLWVQDQLFAFSAAVSLVGSILIGIAVFVMLMFTLDAVTDRTVLPF